MSETLSENVTRITDLTCNIVMVNSQGETGPRERLAPRQAKWGFCDPVIWVCFHVMPRAKVCATYTKLPSSCVQKEDGNSPMNLSASNTQGSASMLQGFCV